MNHWARILLRYVVIQVKAAGRIESRRRVDGGFRMKTTDNVSVTLHTSSQLVFHGGNPAASERLVASWGEREKYHVPPPYLWRWV